MDKEYFADVYYHIEIDKNRDKFKEYFDKDDLNKLNFFLKYIFNFIEHTNYS
jgi:hypothetical protein